VLIDRICRRSCRKVNSPGQPALTAAQCFAVAKLGSSACGILDDQFRLCAAIFDEEQSHEEEYQ